MTKAAACILALAAAAQIGCAEPASPDSAPVDTAAMVDAGVRASDVSLDANSSDAPVASDVGDAQDVGSPDTETADSPPLDDIGAEFDTVDGGLVTETGWFDAIDVTDAAADVGVSETPELDTAGIADGGPPTVDVASADVLDPLAKLPAWPPAAATCATWSSLPAPVTWTGYYWVSVADDKAQVAGWVDDLTTSASYHGYHATVGLADGLTQTVNVALSKAVYSAVGIRRQYPGGGTFGVETTMKPGGSFSAGDDHSANIWVTRRDAVGGLLWKRNPPAPTGYVGLATYLKEGAMAFYTTYTIAKDPLGPKNEARLWLLDDKGDTIVHHKIGGAELVYCYAGAAGKSGGFALAGMPLAGTGSKIPFFVTRLNVWGKPLWKATTEVNAAHSQSLEATLDDGFVLFGTLHPGLLPTEFEWAIGLDKVGLQRFSSDGKALWLRAYDPGGVVVRMIAQNVAALPDSSFLMTASASWPSHSSYQTQHRIWLARADGNGKLMWDRYVPMPWGNNQLSPLTLLPKFDQDKSPYKDTLEKDSGYLRIAGVLPDGHIILGGARKVTDEGRRPWVMRVGPWGGYGCGKVDKCKGKLTTALCDDNNPCTVDDCEPAKGCVHTPHTWGFCGGTVVQWPCAVDGGWKYPGQTAKACDYNGKCKAVQCQPVP